MLGALIGGLAGLLFPPAAAAAGGAAATGIGALLGKAMLPALGAGLGTLATGGDGKDAIRNALLMGAGTAVFPGMGKGLQESKFGRSITGGIADILGLGAESDPNVPPLLRVAQSVMSPSGAGGAPAPAAAPITPETAYNMVRPEGMETPYNMVRPGEPQRTSVPTIGDMNSAPGMTMADDLYDSYLAQPHSLGNSLDLNLAGVGSYGGSVFDSGMIGPENLLPPPYTDDSLNYDEYKRRKNSFMLGGEGFEDRVGLPFDIDEYLARQDRTSRFAMGGAINGPGTGTSDSIPAQIYQDGKPVRKAALSDGEFVMTADAVKGAGNGNRNRGMTRMYELMRRFESGEMA